MKTFREYYAEDIADYISGSPWFWPIVDAFDSNIYYYPVGVTRDGELTYDLGEPGVEEFISCAADVSDWVTEGGPIEEIYDGYESKDNDEFLDVCADLAEKVNDYLKGIADEDDDDEDDVDEDGEG